MINPNKCIKAKEIMQDVAKLYNLRVIDLTGKRRMRNVSSARHFAMCRIRSELQMSFAMIGKLFNRDHSTVIAAVKKLT